MSRTFKAITKKKIDWELLLQAVCKYRDDVQCVDKNPVYYFYNNNFSARGVDVTEEEDGFEIRTTTCSNAADYLLANNIASSIKETTDAVFIDEGGRELFIGSLFSDKAIADHTCGDIEVLKSLLAHKEDITLYGPNRPFHIQQEFTKRINALTGDKYAIAYKFSQMILRCQYPPDEFATGEGFMRVGGEETDNYLIQGFFNTQNMVLENVRAIIVGFIEDKPLLIEPGQLVQHLPESWELLDEFTIAARVLSASYWEKWQQSMIQFSTTLK